VLSDLQTEPTSPAAVAGSSSGPIMSGLQAGPPRPLNTVMLTTLHSHKLPQMLTAWPERDLGNLTVVVEHPVEEPAFARLRRRLRTEGLSWIGARLGAMNRKGSEPAAPVMPPLDVLKYCRSRGIPVVETGPLETTDAVTAIK